jgi:hypothetical protein
VKEICLLDSGHVLLPVYKYGNLNVPVMTESLNRTRTKSAFYLFNNAISNLKYIASNARINQKEWGKKRA